MEPLRTMLSVPANRPKMIEKARDLPADAIVLDLEDSVPVAEKTNARDMARDAIAGGVLAGQRVFVRVNSLASGLLEQDLEAVVIPGLDGINLPKPGSADDIRKVDAIIDRLEKKRDIGKGHVKLTPWVETARGLLNAFEIASASSRIVGIIFGAEDFTLDTGMKRTETGDELLYPRIMVVIAATAAEVIAVDTPYNDFRDEDGLMRETTLARKLGFQGKYVIHPSQIEPVNRAFRPLAEEVDEARSVVQAFDEAEAQGFASTSVDGKMIDTPIANRARRLLTVAESIARRESGGA